MNCCHADTVAWWAAPSCLCVQLSTAGPPPGKQMAGNNTVTHPERWHPGPGLRHALCYLPVCIASEIPPYSPKNHQPIRRHAWVKLTCQMCLVNQTYASISQWVGQVSQTCWVLSSGQRGRWPVNLTVCQLDEADNGFCIGRRDLDNYTIN